MKDDLFLALDAAKGAGSILLRHWHARDALHVESKRAGDFVSEADREAETFLRERLLRARPGDAWLGEETGAMPGVGQAAASRCWVVDPLDGTTNFLRGIGHWAVSVALVKDGLPIVGVVHNPLAQETFAAALGQGATLNGKPIQAAATPLMAHALFGTGIPFGGMRHIDDHAADIARLMPLCAGVRRMGAAALDLAYVAAGRLDGFWERSLRPWDISAGLILMREAGARVEGWKISERPEDSGTIIAAAPQLFDKFSETLRR